MADGRDVIRALGGPLFGRRQPARGDGGSGFDPTRRQLTPQEEEQRYKTALRNEREARARDQVEHAADLERTRAQHADDLQATRDRHAEDLDRTRAQHANDLQAAREGHRADLDRARAEHDNNVRDLTERHNQTLQDQRDSHAQELQQNQEQHQRDLQELQTQHDDLLSNQREIISTQQQALQSSAQREGEMREALRNMNQERDTLRGQIDRLQTEIAEEQQGRQEEVRRLQEDSVRAKEESEGVVQGLNIQIENLRKQNAELKGDADALTRARARLDAFAVQLRANDTEKQRLMEELEQQRNVSTQSQKEATAARIKNRELDAENKSIRRRLRDADEARSVMENNHSAALAAALSEGKKKDNKIKNFQKSQRELANRLGSVEREKQAAENALLAAQREIRQLNIRNSDLINQMNQNEDSSEDSSASPVADVFVTPQRLRRGSSDTPVALNADSSDEEDEEGVVVGQPVNSISDLWQNSVDSVGDSVVDSSMESSVAQYTNADARRELLSILKWWLFRDFEDSRDELVHQELIVAYRQVARINGSEPAGMVKVRPSSGNLQLGSKIELYKANIRASLLTIYNKLVGEEVPRALRSRRIDIDAFLDGMITEFENLGLVGLRDQIMTVEAPRAQGLTMLVDSPMNLTLRL